MTSLTDLYRIETFIDTFAPGHYARVLAAQDVRTRRQVAFKVLRPEHLLDDGDVRWEYRAFGNEAQLLHSLSASPHVVKLLDCGFVATLAEAPQEGEIVSFGLNVGDYIAALHEYAERGWRPYLSLENLARTDNLFYLMRPGRQNARRRLPTEEGLTLALQFANLLRLAHTQKIVYLDHKLEHVYWDGVTLRVIDFNSSQQLLGGTSARAQYTKDVHNLCVGVLYPIFTGMSPLKTTLRPQPGTREEVEARYQDVHELDFMMEPTLSVAVQNLLQAGAAMNIETIDEFINRLEAVASQYGRDFPNHSSVAASRQARDLVKQGLAKLRLGETSIREARDILREALVIDELTPEMEDELRRLVNLINEMLNRRAIP